jgi:hypothetical protein
MPSSQAALPPIPPQIFCTLEDYVNRLLWRRARIGFVHLLVPYLFSSILQFFNFFNLQSLQIVPSRSDNININKASSITFFVFTTASTTALGPTQPPIRWVLGALSLGLNRPRREADRSSPSSSEVKNALSYTSTSPIRLHVVVFSSAQGQLYPLHFRQ